MPGSTVHDSIFLEKVLPGIDVVNVKPHRVPQPVHEIFPASRVCGVLLLHFRRGDQFQAEHLLGHHLMGIVLPILVGFAHGGIVDTLTENPEHGLVDLLLPAGKLALTGTVRVRSTL